MSNRTYMGSDNDWDVIFNAIGMDMESSFIDEEVREELSVAFDNIKEVQEAPENNLDKDLKKIVDMYYNQESEDLAGMDEDDDDGTHIFYALDNIRQYLANK